MTPLKVYIASRAEEQPEARLFAAMFRQAGIEVTSRWLTSPLNTETHDEAQMDIDDVRAADVVVLLKPASAHRNTTGGHHVETGIALERGMPVVLVGQAENVFHRHNTVYVVDWPNGFLARDIFFHVEAQVRLRGAEARATAGRVS